MAIDRLLLLYLLKIASPFGIDGDVKLQQLVFLSELQLFGKQATGFHYRFFRYAYGGYSKELADDVAALRVKKLIDSIMWNLAPAGESVVKVIPGIAKDRSENEIIFSIVQDVVTAYGKYDSSSIVPQVEKIELVLPEKPDADAEGIPRQDSLPIGHISFHATLLVPERIQTLVHLEVKPDLLAILLDLLK